MIRQHSGKTAIVRALLGVALLMLGGRHPVQAQELAEVYLGVYVTAPGESLVIPLTIHCDVASGCGAFEIEISFDPAIVRVEQLELGPYLGDSALIVEDVIDNRAGKVKLVAAALGEIEALSEGDLAYVHLTALKQGVSDLKVVKIAIGDLQGLPVISAAADGSAIVIEAGPVLATVDLPAMFRFLCYAQPVRDFADSFHLIPGAAEITILGKLAPDSESGAEAPTRWVLIEASVSGTSIGPCWATTSSFKISLDNKPIAFDDLWNMIPNTPASLGAEPEQTGEPDNALPCMVQAVRKGVAIRVGPGMNRAVRAAMPVREGIPVIGWFEDDTGSRWWKIQPGDYSEYEEDRYWVAAADVESSGGCEGIAEAAPSRFVYAPPTAAPTAFPTVTTFEVPQGAAPQSPGSLPQPEPTCFTLAIVYNEYNLEMGGDPNSGGVSVSPGPNCSGGRYIGGSAVTVTVWGAPEWITGCGITDYFEEPFSQQITIQGDCTIVVHVIY